MRKPGDLALLTLALAFLTPGCATTTTYEVKSVPPGARISIDNVSRGVTPATITLPDTQGIGLNTYTLVLRKEGYKVARAGLHTQLPFYAVNLVLEPQRPATYTETSEASWTSIEVPRGVVYEDAWARVFDLLVRDFDIDIVEKEAGYLVTRWSDHWGGQRREFYRLRATVKFKQDRSTIELRSEASFWTGNTWTLGTDSRLQETLTADIAAAVGTR